MNRRTKLTDTLVRRLKPGNREYTVRDTLVPGLGVRVHPSGGRSYVLFREGMKVSLGPVTLMTLREARSECLAFMTDGFSGGRTVPLFRDFASGAWRDSWVCRCKPSTVLRQDQCLQTRLLPAFGTLRLDQITTAKVNRWFDSYSRTAPSGANYCLKILRHILNHAVACLHIASNPAQSVRLNPRKKLTRFLSQEELGRLHRVLDRHGRPETTKPSQRQQVDIIRLLLLTGCRKNEIIRLRKQEVAENCLRLLDSKTGPRKVFLNTEARAIIERRMASDGVFLFPSPHDPERPINDNLPLWYAVRREAGIEDVRIHDLRHTFASHAVMQGTPLPVVARLLGHSQAAMTLRYAHTGDLETEAAAERIGEVISSILNVG